MTLLLVVVGAFGFVTESDECEAVPAAIAGDGLTSYKLYQNVPNPFNPTTTIHYEIPAGLAAIRLQIFDVSGRLVRRLVDGYVGPGRKSASWSGLDTSGRPVASGLYFYRLEAGRFNETRKMLLLK